MNSDKKIQFKPQLTVTKIGKFRFWLGILYGVLSAFIFFCFTFLLLEIADLFIVFWNHDIPTTSNAIPFFEKIFLMALSIAFGNSAILRCWFSRPTNYFDKRKKYSSTRVVNYSWFITYIVWYGFGIYVSRFLFQFPYVDLAIFETFGYVLLLFPVCLFYISWMEISRYVKSQAWMLKAFTYCFVLLALVSFIDLSKYSIGEIAFRRMHYEKIEFLEKEIEKAKRDYNITFTKETISGLTELRTERAFDLLDKTRLAFKTEGKVSLDTIILEKILIHNFKGYYIDRRQSYKYIFPFQVYDQLRKVDPKSREATELLNILAEFHKLNRISSEIQIEENNSIMYKHKTEVLNADIHEYEIRFNYLRMKNQTEYLLYHIQKLGTYKHHSLFNTQIPYPPAPTMHKEWIKEKFPEFTTPE